MVFLVRRASLWDRNKCPCEEAKQSVVYCDDSKREEKFWTIEVNSLEELISFKNKHGGIILEDSFMVKGYAEILIYDDYIE